MIKRGATFRAEVTFSDAEWAEIYPHDSLVARLRQGADLYDLAVTVSPAARTISLTADTTQWRVGSAQFDLWVTQGTIRTPIPYGRNMTLKIIEGVAG